MPSANDFLNSFEVNNKKQSASAFLDSMGASNDVEDQAIQAMRSRTRGPGVEDLPYPEFPLAPTTLDNPELARTTQGKLNIIRKKHPSAKLSFENGTPVISVDEELGPYYPAGQKYVLNKPGLSAADLQSLESVGLRTAAPVATGLLFPPSAVVSLGTPLAAAGVGTAAMANEAVAQWFANQVGADEGISIFDIGTAGMFASIGEGVGTGVSRALGGLWKLFKKIKPGAKFKPSDLIDDHGKLSPVAEKIRQEHGLTYDEIRAMASDEIKQLPDDITTFMDEFTPDEQARLAVYRQAGFVDDASPDLAQITRDPTLGARRDQLMRSADPNALDMRAKDIAQNNALIQKSDRLKDLTGGVTKDSFHTGQGANAALENIRREVDSVITKFYKEVRESVGDNAVVDPTPILNKIDDMVIEDEFNLTNTVRARLVKFGVLDKEGEVLRPMTIREAEAIRKSTNALSRHGGFVGHEVRTTIDDAVKTSAGEDFFGVGRDLARHKFQEFNTKTGYRKLIKLINDEKVTSKNLFNRMVVNSDPDELLNFKNILTDPPFDKTIVSESAREIAKQSWNDVRGETINFMKSSALTSGLDDAGNQVWSGAGWKKAYDKIGEDKLNMLFTPKEMATIKAIKQSGLLRYPPRDLQNFSNTASRAGQMLDQMLDKLPVVGRVVTGARAAGRNAAMKRALAKDVSSMLSPGNTKASINPFIRRIVTPPSIAAAIYGGNQLDQNDIVNGLAKILGR